jgi:hypothetical protein
MVYTEMLKIYDAWKWEYHAKAPLTTLLVYKNESMGFLHMETPFSFLTVSFLSFAVP